MTANFKRAWSIGNLDQTSGLRIRFECISHTQQELGRANIILTNVSPSTYQQFQSEFSKITLQVGYEGNLGTIFSGTITMSEYGEKEEWTDVLLKLWARDGDTGYNQGKVNQTLAPGSTPQDIVNTCLKSWQPFGISMGHVLGVDLSTPKFPRGYVLAGMSRDFLREVATSKRATWNLNGGNLNIVSKDSQGAGGGITPVVIGKPIQTISGIKVRCLINSAIQVDGTVVIDQASIVKPVVNNQALDANEGNVAELLSKQGASDGTYRVLQITAIGDSRGQDWYMDLICVGAITGAVNVTQAQKGLSYAAPGLGLS